MWGGEEIKRSANKAEIRDEMMPITITISEEQRGVEWNKGKKKGEEGS